MSEFLVSYVAHEIFKVFRDQQQDHGNRGCRCPECLEDMQKAVKNVFEELQIKIESGRVLPVEAEGLF